MLGGAELRFEVHMQRLTDRQLSVMQSLSQSAHLSTGMALLYVSVKSVQQCLIFNIYTGACGQSTDGKKYRANLQSSVVHTCL